MPVTVRLAEPQDLPAVTAIAEETFSKGYFLVGATELVLVAQCGGQIVGFMCGSVGPEEANLRTICVTHTVRRQGIATRLGETFIRDWARSMPIRSPAWIRKDGAIPAEPLLRGLGLERAELKPGYWREETIRRHLVCPDCGPPACNCIAQIFRGTGR